MKLTDYLKEQILDTIPEMTGCIEYNDCLQFSWEDDEDSGWQSSAADCYIVIEIDKSEVVVYFSYMVTGYTEDITDHFVFVTEAYINDKHIELTNQDKEQMAKQIEQLIEVPYIPYREYKTCEKEMSNEYEQD